MKRFLVSLGLVLGLVTASYAAIPVPTDKQNVQIVDPRWAGASVCDVGVATGTTDLLCTTGKGIVFGILVSSGAGASTNFVTLRDSATLNHTSVALLTGSTSGSAVNQTILFPMSVKFSNGISATMSATPGSNEHWQIFYRLQSDQN